MGKQQMILRREELHVVAEPIDLTGQEDDIPRIGCDDADLADFAVGDIGQDLVQG